MYGRETVAARQLLGTCFLLRDTTPIKDPPKKMGCSQAGQVASTCERQTAIGDMFSFEGHPNKSGAGSLLTVPPNKDSKTVVLV